MNTETMAAFYDELEKISAADKVAVSTKWIRQSVHAAGEKASPEKLKSFGDRMERKMVDGGRHNDQYFTAMRAADTFPKKQEFKARVQEGVRKAHEATSAAPSAHKPEPHKLRDLAVGATGVAATAGLGYGLNRYLKSKKEKKASEEKDSGFMGDLASKVKTVATTPIAGTPSLNPFHGAAELAKGMKSPGSASRGFQQFQQMRSAAGH